MNSISFKAELPLKVKIFSDLTPEDAEKQINAWISKQEPGLRICNISHSLVRKSGVKASLLSIVIVYDFVAPAPEQAGSYILLGDDSNPDGNGNSGPSSSGSGSLSFFHPSLVIDQPKPGRRANPSGLDGASQR